jgi:putative FmdB family regulatory protein
MATYEYTCPNCGHEFERWCTISERKNQNCPECDNIGRQVVRTPAQPHWTSLAMGDSASPEAIKRFDKMRREQKDKETKSMSEHGDYGRSPGS